MCYDELDYIICKSSVKKGLFLMEKINLGFLFGGASSEYEVSLMSASSALAYLNLEKYNLFQIGITQDGRWLLYRGGTDAIRQNTWQDGDCLPCLLSPDRSHHGILVWNTPDQAPELIRLDCVFPMLHGKNGEDGTIQGLLTVAGIPFVGCGTLSSAACMDKVVTRTLLESAGIRGARWVWTNETNYQADPDAFFGRAEKAFGYPCFVKPANAGSSVGISKVKSREEFPAAMALALKNDSKILVEEFLSGREIECAVLGNERPRASCLGEILPSNEFYDYNAKYLDGKSRTLAPAPISPESTEEIRQTAVQAYRVMGCTGLARVDFFLGEDGRVFLNELNTLPGFTQISMYPQLFEKDGLPYSKLIDKLIACAMQVERGRA